MNNESIKGTLKKLKKVIKNHKYQHTPFLDKDDQKSVLESIKNKNVSTYGKYIEVFEKRLKNYYKYNNIVTTVNGTSALHTILTYLKAGIEDEILVQSFTFVATINPILYTGAYPHFIDSSLESLSADPDKLDKYLNSDKFKFKNGILFNKSTKKKIKILIITHVYGYPAEIIKLKSVAKKYNLVLIEDAAETLGSYLNKTPLGKFGDFSILSFNGNKVITTGGGGAILCKKNNDLKKITNLIIHSKVQKKDVIYYDNIGFNYKLPSLNAALGVSQLKKINYILKKKRELKKIYQSVFKYENVNVYEEFNSNYKGNNWIILLKVKERSIFFKLVKHAKYLGFGIKRAWKPLHNMKHLKKYQKMNLSNCKKLFNSLLLLPSDIN